MSEHAAEFRIGLMCRVFEVSRSGYYDWRKRQDAVRQEKRVDTLLHIRRVFQGSKQRYGSPRIYRQLKAEGVRIGRHRIARLMREAHLVARRRRRYQRLVTTTRHHHALAANVLDRQFRVGPPNRVWVADVSYVWTHSGWIHLAIVLDLGSRRVIGWSMGHRVDATLSRSALEMALLHRQPVGEVLHHSDQGSEYTNHDYQQLIKDSGMRSSMSRRRECHDNAVAESFFKTIKVELARQQKFRTPQEARSAIFEYIEVFYNRRRLHSSLGYLSPAQYEEQYTTD